MKSLGTPSRISSQNHLFNLFTTEFRDAQQASELFDEFLRHETYNKSFCLKLISVAKQRTEGTWDVRRLAVLMLEHQILKLDPDRIDDFDFLLTQLNLQQASGLNHGIVRSVLKEGYSTTDLRDFIPEFRRKLERLNYAHNKIRGRKTPDTAVRDFIRVSRRDCKLSLARYLFTPEEVVDEILRQLHVTGGVTDLDASQSPFVEDEITSVMRLLPDFEGQILKRLCAASNIYWVSQTTSSEINSLVEYPITTVVLVVKPPGSDIEFEFKRAGRRGHNPLNVVYARNGYTVAPSHRLDGGNMLWLLQYEAIAASKLGVIYRLVHGTEPPIAYYVSRSTIYSVPGREAEVQTLPYFTDSQLFGNGFREMRTAMKESVDAFTAEGVDMLPELNGDLGLTTQFIGHVAPAQAILSGTTSFRLDKLANYLSSNGPETYFTEGLAVGFRNRDARRLADELLEEVLGVYHPPDVTYQTYKQYLAAGFAVAENRVRADRTYLSLVQQIARFWGTLLGVRGYTRGESFVARNVGLKSFWDKGQWNVRIIFMDHDAVAIPGPEDEYFYIPGALPCMMIDERHIWDRSTPERFVTSEVGYLQRIYRIGKEVDAKGRALADMALRDAYKKTQHELLTNPRLQPLFNGRFIERLLDWDTVVDGYLQSKPAKSPSAAWKRKMRAMLDAKGYKRVALDSYIEIIEENLEFLGRYAHLFKAEETISPDPDYNPGDLLVALASR